MSCGFWACDLFGHMTGFISLNWLKVDYACL